MMSVSSNNFVFLQITLSLSKECFFIFFSYRFGILKNISTFASAIERDAIK